MAPLMKNDILKTIKGSDLWSLIPNQSQFNDEYEKAITEQRDIYKARCVHIIYQLV